MSVILSLIQCFYGNISAMPTTVIPQLIADWLRAGAVVTQQANQSVARL